MNNRTNSLHWLGTLVFFNTLILCCCGLPAALTDPIPQSFTTSSFYLLSYVAQNFLYASIMGIILLPIFLMRRAMAVKIYFSVFFVALFQIVCFINAKVYGFWRFYINKTMLHLLFIGGAKVFEVRDSLYLWLFMMVVLLLIASGLTVFLSYRLKKYFNLRCWLGFFLGIYLIAQSLFLFFCMQNNMRFLQYTIKIPYFYNLSVVNVLQKTNISVFPENASTKKLETVLSINKKLQYPLRPLNYHLPNHPLNVLLIVIDTLRYDMVNPINMPNLYRYAQHENQFLDNLSGGDCTRPGIFSLFYGIPATYWDAAEKHRQGSIVIRAFQDNHYRLGIFASAPLYSPPFDRTVFSTVKNLKLTTSGRTSLDRDAKVTEEMQQFLNHARESKKPFFGFMFYDAPHAYNASRLDHPFHPIKNLNYFNINNNTARTPIYNLYKNSVYADDQLLEKILLTLKKNNLNKNTVVIITADHGQEFNEYHNNYWEHASDFSKYQMQTPMIIAWPNQSPKIFHDQTTHFDLAPTLLKRVLGVSNPVSDYSVGDDIFSKKQPDFVIAGNYGYFALISKKNIVEFHDSGFYRVTDLKMKSLPDEEISLADFSPALEEMKRYF